MNTRSIGLAAVLLVAMTLAGCKGTLLDYRNAQLAHGLFYAGDANEPFSGTVTHVPDGVILRGQQGLVAYAQVMNNLYLLNGIGLGMSECEVRVRDGLLDGDATCTQSGTDKVMREMHFSGGNLDGDFTLVMPNYTSSTHFSDGQLDGEIENHSVATGKLIYRVRFTHGVVDGDEASFDPQTGNQTLAAHYAHGARQGDLVQYAADGKQVLYKASFDHGQQIGSEERFDPGTGQRVLLRHWDNGELNGKSQEWEPDGRLKGTIVYAHNGIVSEHSGDDAVTPTPEPTPVPIPDDVVKLRGGELRIEHHEENPVLLVNNQRLYAPETFALNIEKTFQLTDADVVLVMNDSGGIACPSQFVLVTVPLQGAPKVSQEFGTCNDEVTTSQNQGVISVTMADLTIRSKKTTYRFANGAMTESTARDPLIIDNKPHHGDVSVDWMGRIAVDGDPDPRLLRCVEDLVLKGESHQDDDEWTAVIQKVCKQPLKR